jgi:hypothetical protein
LVPPPRALSGRGDELRLGLEFDCSDSKLADIKKKVGIPHPKLNEPAVDSGEWSNFGGKWIGQHAPYSHSFNRRSRRIRPSVTIGIRRPDYRPRSLDIAAG